MYKLMSIAGYGKTIENLGIRVDVRLVSNKRRLFKMDIQTKLYVTQNIWQCILELSKILMYEFHYDYIKNKYCNNSRLLFTDTDSLMYEIKSEEVYEDFRNDKKIFDFSNYSAKSK